MVFTNDAYYFTSSAKHRWKLHMNFTIGWAFNFTGDGLAIALSPD